MLSNHSVREANDLSPMLSEMKMTQTSFSSS